MSKVARTIATATATNFAGTPILIEVVLGENGLYGIISNGITDGKVYLTEAEARAAANRTWKRIRAHRAAEYARTLAPQQTAAEIAAATLGARGTWSTPAEDYAHGVATRAILNTK